LRVPISALEPEPELEPESVVQTAGVEGEEEVEEEEESEELTGPFPGGPEDPRILRSFKTHIAADIWNRKV
jgi:hypothetical protein